MKLKCLGQPAPRTGPITVVEMGFRRVQKGEIVEVEESLANILMERYKGRFEKAPASSQEKQAEPPQNKAMKKESIRNKKAESGVEELL